MILLVFTATLLVLGSTYYQYRTESEQYNTYRQDRKETQLTKQINYIASKFDLTNNYEKWENYKVDFEEITKTIVKRWYNEKAFREMSKDTLFFGKGVS